MRQDTVGASSLAWGDSQGLVFLQLSFPYSYSGSRNPYFQAYNADLAPVFETELQLADQVFNSYLVPLSSERLRVYLDAGDGTPIYYQDFQQSSGPSDRDSDKFSIVRMPSPMTLPLSRHR